MSFISVGPMFKWFGSKWSARGIPDPVHERILEPFGGGGGYSLRRSNLDVMICEDDPHNSVLWPWLINVATESLILEIPVDVPEGTDIRTLGLTTGQALLMKSWQRTNNVGDCWTVSPWGNKPGQWTTNTRARVAEQVYAVKHWLFASDGMRILTEEIALSTDADRRPTTYFIDPMYQYNYQYRHANRTDYADLGRVCMGLRGQVIVCEAACQKSGAVPSWLPFTTRASQVTSRRKTTQNHHSAELIWLNQ